MPEIRCPMCSKPNPEENEVCQFCQARLKPLVVSQPPDEKTEERPVSGASQAPAKGQPHPPPPTSSPTEDLSRLRSEYEELLPDLFPSEDNALDQSSTQGQPHPPPPTSSPTEDLSRLRSEYEELLPDLFPPEENALEQDQDSSTGSGYEEPESSDEYLVRLEGDAGTGELKSGQPQKTEPPSNEPDKPVPEWLARIREKEGTGSLPSQPEEQDKGDWLTRLRQKEETQEDQGTPAGDQSDMAGTDADRPPPESLRPDQAAEEVESKASSDLPPLESDAGTSLDEPESESGWLSSSSGPEEDGSPVDPAEKGGMLDWLAGSSPVKPDVEPDAAEPAPDWMADTDAEDDGEPTVGPFASGPVEREPSDEGSPEETPSWLADELDDGGDEQEDGGSLSWLESEVDVKLEELDSGAFMAVEDEDEVELPGWLAEAVDPTKAAGAESENFDSTWREKKQAQEETGSESGGPPGEHDLVGESPLGPDSKPFVGGTEPPEAQADDITWDQLKGEASSSSDLDVPSRPFVEPPKSDQEQPVEEQGGLGLPAWLDEIREPPPEPEQPPQETPALIMRPGAPSQSKSEDSGLNLNDLELPEWIGDMRDDAASGGEGSPQLAPATLPTWLEAMRPIESFQADQALVPEDDQSVESIGPLAGLRGVLAAEPIMAMPRTATIGGSRLEVSQEQYARAEMLARMVQDEQQEQAQLKPERRRIPIARLLVTLALLAALFFSLPGRGGVASNRFLPPENQPQSLSNLYDLVANAPLDRPVLVVFDYSPAYAGELETYAAPILADIVSRDLKIITVSTHPTGPPLASRLLQHVSGDRELQNTRDYLHFGYLSGGPTAVQLFAANPRHALLYGFQLPVGTQTAGIWSYPIVENVSQLSDFGMLVVITAATDSARTWVEQAGPYLGDTPLALVLSAGVEPLLQPYAVGVEPQVDNILSGLPVAYVYEGYMVFDGTARINWDAFGSMLSVVELILIGGAVYGLVSYVLRAMGVVKE